MNDKPLLARGKDLSVGKVYRAPKTNAFFSEGDMFLVLSSKDDTYGYLDVNILVFKTGKFLKI